MAQSNGRLVILGTILKLPRKVDHFAVHLAGFMAGMRRLFGRVLNDGRT